MNFTRHLIFGFHMKTVSGCKNSSWSPWPPVALILLWASSIRWGPEASHGASSGWEWWPALGPREIMLPHKAMTCELLWVSSEAVPTIIFCISFWFVLILFILVSFIFLLHYKYVIGIWVPWLEPLFFLRRKSRPCRVNSRGWQSCRILESAHLLTCVFSLLYLCCLFLMQFQWVQSGQHQLFGSHHKKVNTHVKYWWSVFPMVFKMLSGKLRALSRKLLHISLTR